jgi:hypothetical protein
MHQGAPDEVPTPSDSNGVTPNDGRGTFLSTERGVLTVASVGPRSFPKYRINP